MSENEKQLTKRKLYPLTQEGFVLLLLLIAFVPLQLNFGQLSPVFLFFQQHETHLQEFDSSTFMDGLFPWENDNLKNNGISVQQTDKSESGFIALIDSMYEVQNFGYYNELYRWYYHYNEQQKADSVWRYFYNSKGEYEKITEIRTYNNDGQIARLVKRQPDFLLWQWYGDSTIIEYYTEEYAYQQGNLVRKIVTTNYQGTQSVTKEYHTYDSENRLIRDSLVGSDGYSSSVTAYTYNADNDLEYMLYVYAGMIYAVNKYEYEKTDTSQFTTHHWIYYNTLTENPILDTITHWIGEYFYYETFDELGRRTGLRREYFNIYYGAGIDYKAEYSYTDNNDLLHATYYDWIGEPDSGYWQEATRIDNTYDNDYNLELYEKTFYDARTEEWETDNSKTYYFSFVPVGLTENIAGQPQLYIYPNPASDVIYVNGLNHEIPIFTIYNISGEVVLNGRMENSTIPVTNLKNGMYFIKLWDGNSFSFGRFIKD
jgi:hypothetical protein